MEEEILSRVYALLDEKNRVTRIEGEYTLPSNLDDWTFIDEGSGDRYNLAQTHYLDEPLIEEHGVYQYKYYRKKIVKRSEEEIAADIVEPEPTPTWQDTIEAQVMYTALMTDTLIEEV